MTCLGALLGVLGGWSVGIPVYLGTMSITGPLNCLLGCSYCCGLLTPCASFLALLMGGVGGGLAGISGLICGPLAPAIAGPLGGMVGLGGSAICCIPLSISNCITSCIPYAFCCGANVPIGMCYALVNIPITTCGGMLAGCCGGSGPCLGLAFFDEPAFLCALGGVPGAIIDNICGFAG